MTSDRGTPALRPQPVFRPRSPVESRRRAAFHSPWHHGRGWPRREPDRLHRAARARARARGRGIRLPPGRRAATKCAHAGQASVMISDCAWIESIARRLVEGDGDPDPGGRHSGPLPAERRGAPPHVVEQGMAHRGNVGLGWQHVDEIKRPRRRRLPVRREAEDDHARHAHIRSR